MSEIERRASLSMHSVVAAMLQDVGHGETPLPLAEMAACMRRAVDMAYAWVRDGCAFLRSDAASDRGAAGEWMERMAKLARWGADARLLLEHMCDKGHRVHRAVSKLEGEEGHTHSHHLKRCVDAKLDMQCYAEMLASTAHAARWVHWALSPCRDRRARRVGDDVFRMASASPLLRSLTSLVGRVEGARARAKREE